MNEFTKSEKEVLGVQSAINAFNASVSNPNSNLAPIYSAIIASRHFGTFGEIAARKHFNINPNFAIPVYKSMGGAYNTY
jgi:hypothetical protein